MAEALLASGSDADAQRVYADLWLAIEVSTESLAVARALRASGVGVHLATNQDLGRAAYMQARAGVRRRLRHAASTPASSAGEARPSSSSTSSTTLGVPADRVLFVDDSQANVDGAREVGLRAERWHLDDGMAVLEALLDRPRADQDLTPRHNPLAGGGRHVRDWSHDVLRLAHHDRLRQRLRALGMVEAGARLRRHPRRPERARPRGVHDPDPAAGHQLLFIEVPEAKAVVHVERRTASTSTCGPATAPRTKRSSGCSASAPPRCGDQRGHYGPGIGLGGAGRPGGQRVLHPALGGRAGCGHAATVTEARPRCPRCSGSSAGAPSARSRSRHRRCPGGCGPGLLGRASRGGHEPRLLTQ